MGLFGFNAEKKLKKGSDFLEKGIYYEARRTFEEIIVRDGVDPWIVEQAKAGWRRARESLMENQVAEARRLVQAGEIDEAAECCRAAVEQAGSDIDAGEAAKLLAELEQGLGAAQKILEGIDDLPDRPAEPNVEGEVEEEIVAGPEALFEVLLQPLPKEQAEAFRSFGQPFRDGYLHLQEGRPKEALACFDAIPEEIARDPLARLERAQALMVDERDEDALGELENLDLPVGLQRRRQEMRVVLLHRTDRGEDAEQEARAVWDGAREDPEAITLYADILLRNEKPREVLELIEPLRTPNLDPEIGRLLVGAQIGAGQVQEARDLLEETVEQFFQTPGGLHSRFPLWAARELFALYVGVNEEPKRVRSLVQHLIHHDPGSANIYKGTLAKYAEDREKGRSDAAPSPPPTES